MHDRDKDPYIVFARVDVQNMERSSIWRSDAANLPEGTRLHSLLRQPFNNFKSCRQMVGTILDKDPLKVKYQAFKGARTLFPTEEELAKLIEPVTDQPKTARGIRVQAHDTTYTV